MKRWRERIRIRLHVRSAVIVFLFVVASSRSTWANVSNDWMRRSNENASLLTRVLAEYNPESSSDSRYESAIMTVNASSHRRMASELSAVVVELRRRLSRESDARVRTDLLVLIDSAQQSEEMSAALSRAFPYHEVTADVYAGISVLLDAQGAATRSRAALARLRKYVGLDGVHESLASQEMRIAKEALANGRAPFPFRTRLQDDLRKAPVLRVAVVDAFRKSASRESAPVVSLFLKQSVAYDEFLKLSILPRTQRDFRLPRDLYVATLLGNGVTSSPESLIVDAKKAFADMLPGVQSKAREVAAAHGWGVISYRETIRRLKREQVPSGAVLAFYRRRADEIDARLRRLGIVTMPSEKLRIRLASDAESVSIPAPFFNPPPLTQKQSGFGEFVLPLHGQGAAAYDDFTYDAASWFLLSHEGYPGHGLQFNRIVHRGTSIARSVYAFTSANVEGWAMYSEWFMEPYMPIEGQLAARQFRLARAAYMFLDPELQLGLIGEAEARRVLTGQVGISRPYADSLIRRMTYLSPGQATSYYYGYEQLRTLRSSLQGRPDCAFDARAFHDSVLAQGLLPLPVLKSAVTREWLASRPRDGACHRRMTLGSRKIAVL